MDLIFLMGLAWSSTSPRILLRRRPLYKKKVEMKVNRAMSMEMK
jgi:hypothetical protein